MTMNWNQLISPVRLGSKSRPTLSNDVARSSFQKDYDRLLFSAPFRRLQDKTQVFPLPGSVFVHNRLTHSLEVASIGRSLGDMVARELLQRGVDDAPFIAEMGSIVSAACLAHDIGNPPFGHAGEQAISHYFTDGEGRKLQTMVTEAQWTELIHFEGNANAFRLLTHQFQGRRAGGMALTLTTLASLVKYPWQAAAMTNKKKYGFFTHEEQVYRSIAAELGIPLLNADTGVFARHPLVYLVEAADDIAYQLMDLEDALKLGILDVKVVEELFMGFFNEDDDERFFEIKSSVFEEVTDIHERIAFLRATVISKLISQVVDIFVDQQEALLEGTFQGSMVSHLPESSRAAFKKVSSVSVSRIYRHPDVVAIELTGYRVLGSLLEAFNRAIQQPSNPYNQKLLSLIPSQYEVHESDPYLASRSVLDFVSGMTDLYAVKLHRVINGMEQYS